MLSLRVTGSKQHSGVLVGVFLLCSLLGLTINRVAYEWSFPHAIWLNSGWSAVLFAVVTGLAGCWLAYRLLPILSPGLVLLVFVPLALNLVTVFAAEFQPVDSRILLFGSLWLSVVLLIAVLHPHARHWVWLAWLFVALAALYGSTMGRTVGSADTFEFQVIAPQLGIAHPTGYPLYLILGKLWTLLPFGSVAWRLNLGTATYALIAAGLVYFIVRRLFDQPLPALLAAVAFGISPTLWSQATVAEVYSLNALLVAAALLVMVVILGKGERGKAQGDSFAVARSYLRLFLLLAFLIGLGLTNHITTLLLLPAAGLTFLFALPSLRENGVLRQPRFWIGIVAAFLLPLLLYAYLPLRWQAVNGEAMGFGRFISWVTGSRFQGALQWLAWLRDDTRYNIIGRLFTTEWGLIGLIIVAVGLVVLVMRQRRVAVILTVAWLTYTFYALNYYVPDLAVFLIPAHLIVAVGIGSALAVRQSPAGIDPIQLLSFTALVALALLALPQTWAKNDRSAENQLLIWGEGILNGDLNTGSAILADSEKIAPLYYLQQAEGVRPDLDITVLPDEAAYRAEMDARLAAGQTVYLARYLPRLPYAMRSNGPLAEMIVERETALLQNEPLVSAAGIDLIDVTVSAESPYDPTQTAVTFTWQATEPATEPLLVHLRWSGDAVAGTATKGRHPVNNLYPTVAWQPGEIVTDFHQLPRPLAPHPQTLALQVALAPAFTPAADLNWQTAATVALPAATAAATVTPLRVDLGDLFLDGVSVPTQIRPNTPLPVTLSGHHLDADTLTLTLAGAGGSTHQSVTFSDDSDAPQPFAWQTELDTTGLTNGLYALRVDDGNCGWMRGNSAECKLADITIDGVPLPADATNFDDKIALLETTIPETGLIPGGLFDVTFTWQALAPLTEDYTVFVQILDENDNIVGQIDAWPVQGTLPTTTWQPGQIITDPYTVQLAPDLAPGNYRLVAGWYLLATAQRLPVIDSKGISVDDKITVPNLTLP
ncbi:MAG: DUF2723 domain-containing protein [Anaerolineae bacterium]|nr:DUF2723 domain-containing protein [Anaerolineae bacterium]